MKVKRTYISDKLEGPVFQNGPFYTSKWAILLGKMSHSACQNGPFSRVKRPILRGWNMSRKYKVLVFSDLKKLQISRISVRRQKNFERGPSCEPLCKDS